MKRLLVFILLFTFTFTITSCGLFKRPAHCPAYDNVHAKTDKKGEFKTSKTKSNLFPKKMRKKK